MAETGNGYGGEWRSRLGCCSYTLPATGFRRPAANARSPEGDSAAALQRRSGTLGWRQTHPLAGRSRKLFMPIRPSTRGNKR